MRKYYSIITNRGAERIAQAIATGEKVNIAAMAVGDGHGELPTPSPEQSALVGEQYRAPLNNLKIYPGGNNTVMAEMVIPAEIGGFWVREAALYSADGEILAVGNVPETYKPQLAEGSGRVQTIRMVLTVSSTEHIELLIDPSIVLATVQYVDEAVQIALNAAADALATAGEKVTFDEMHPIGSVRFFATVLDPNEKWPGTHWVYTGENKSIRIGKKDGTDVLSEGGSDTATLTVENMPKHSHGVSGNVGEFDHGNKGVSEFDHGTKITSESGDHTHQGGMGAPGAVWDGDYIVGSDNDNHRTRNWTSGNGNHTHTVDIGAHSHTVEIGKHGHTVDITSAEVGGGEAISIIENHIKLMCWYRAA
ncbi:phage tail protein [Serratia liquefaciens]|uniref:phage tail protein n=1 Tax=Serratia liquefaciens TaxID=614 RepID=UPI00301E46C4